jgi:hypothetical protein
MTETTNHAPCDNRHNTEGKLINMQTPSQVACASITPINQLSTKDGIQPLDDVLPTQDTPETNPQTPDLDAAQERDERKRGGVE